MGRKGKTNVKERVGSTVDQMDCLGGSLGKRTWEGICLCVDDGNRRGECAREERGSGGDGGEEHIELNCLIGLLRNWRALEIACNS